MRYNDYRINKKRARSVAARLSHGRIRHLYRHPQNGRNGIFVAVSEGGDLFIKQILERTNVISETLANSINNESSFFLKNVQSYDRIGVFVYPYLSTSITLEQVAQLDGRETLERIAIVAEQYFSASCNWDGVADQLSPIERFFTSFADVEGLLDCSPAYRKAIAALLATPLRYIPTFAELSSDLKVSHGDIKLDNILVNGQNTFLVDWELLGLAPAAWDLACFVGCGFIACMRENSHATKQINFNHACDYALKLIRVYENHFKPVNKLYFRLLICHYMIDRLLSETAYALELTPMQGVWIRLVEQLFKGSLI